MTTVLSQDQLRLGMAVYPCNKDGTPRERAQNGRPQTFYECRYAPGNKEDLGLYPEGKRIDALFGRGRQFDPKVLFAPKQTFSLEHAPSHTLFVVFMEEDGSFLLSPADEEILILVNGSKEPLYWCDEPKELTGLSCSFLIPPGAKFIPTSRIGGAQLVR